MASRVKSGASARFDIAALRETAGVKGFARGEACFADDAVEIIATDARRVRGRVSGTEVYKTELTGRGTEIQGDCSCPAVEERGFCKHMVALALAANAAGADAGTAGDDATARIRKHLLAQSVDALADMIVSLAQDDIDLFRRLDMAAALTGGDDKTVAARLRNALDSAMRTNHYIDYRAARDWAANVEAALDAIAPLAEGPRAAIALELALHAVDRIEDAIGSIDDSGGHCGGLLHRARDIHLAAARVVKPEPEKLARDLFRRERESDFGIFCGAAEFYAEVLGEKGLAIFRDLIETELKKLPPPQRVGKKTEGLEERRALSDMLDFFLERDGDLDARIAMRVANLSSQWSYVTLAEFCRANGREEEALHRIEEALWLFEDEGPDTRVLALAVEMFHKAGRKADAETLLRRAFEKQPSLSLYADLGKVGGVGARDHAIAFLEARLERERPTRWHNPADLLVAILNRENMFDAAWTVVRQYGASLAACESLARSSEATHKTEALAIYVKRVDELAEAGNGSSYDEAAALVGRMRGLRAAAEQSAYVANLRVRFRRKRNFMKLLDLLDDQSDGPMVHKGASG